LEPVKGNAGQHQGLRAVAVDRIPADMLDWDTAQRGVDLDQLATAHVSDPENMDQRPAVLSWRWDRPTYEGRSRNVALALIHARRAGVRYLFFDYVSLDQKQPNETLLRDVVALGRLFSRIPVIAAYDEVGTDMMHWSRTLRRPWILYEIRSYSTNPSRITYVGFLHSDVNRRDLSFENEVRSIRNDGFATVILEILNRRVQMTSIADFRLILPPFEKTFAAAMRTFNRADYLLAVFLLTAADENSQTVERDGQQLNYGFRTGVSDPGFEGMELERFSVDPVEGTGFAFESQRNIRLDGETVAICRSKMTSAIGYDRVWVQVLPNYADRIFHTIGLTSRALTEFNDSYEARRAALYVDRSGPWPCFDEAIARIAETSWSADIPEPASKTLGFSAFEAAHVTKPMS
jgi:hypothetical protein